MKFWLIQRGDWNRYNKTENEITGLTGRDGLIELDYMGSSEFEWGAIPKAYRRIMAEFSQYKLIETDIQNCNGVPIQLFCREDRTQEIISELKNFMNAPYHLKEFSELDKCIKPIERVNGKIIPYMTKRTNFWWEIDNGIDCMFFFGMNDRRTLFTNVINKDYNEWWMAKDENKRKEEVQQAFSA